MQRDDLVVLCGHEYEHGLGTVKGLDQRGRLWVLWADEHIAAYDPLALELAHLWESRVVDEAAKGWMGAIQGKP